jgi:hypothetical protein
MRGKKYHEVVNDKSGYKNGIVRRRVYPRGIAYRYSLDHDNIN